jgi:hypothetical protein
MVKKDKYTSEYKYNPLNPFNWSILTLINVICVALLIIDWIIGFSVPIADISTSFLTDVTGGNEFFLRIFPLIALIIILLLSPLLNKEIDDTPFFGVIIIKVVLYLGSNQYTIMGDWVESILTFTCSVVIVVILVFMTFFEIDEPVNHVQGMLIALGILAVDFIVNSLIFGWRINETWALIYISIAFFGILLIHKDYVLIGALAILVMAIFNDYVVDFDLNGFDAGAELMKFFSGFLVAKGILNLI